MAHSLRPLLIYNIVDIYHPLPSADLRLHDLHPLQSKSSHPLLPPPIPITRSITNLVTSTDSPSSVPLARSSPHHPPHTQRSLRSRARPNPHPSRRPQEDHQLQHHRLQQHHPNKPMVSELRSHGTNAHAARGAPPRGAERPRLQREAAVGASDLGGLGGGQDPDEPVVSDLAV